MQQSTLNVQGMSCGHCVNKVEENVGQLEGVESVKVHLSDEKVDVSFDESVVELADIKGLITNSGYEVVEDPGNDGGCSCCH
ncbi:copper chaperone CopZ [Halobacillus sp. H74]|uniref:copper chaperone CopZ n=1 Tax=Halobacillus sp. H74 TaxID=3457436 RepID=UPI003FCDF0D1